MQRCEGAKDLVNLGKCCKMSIYLQKIGFDTAENEPQKEPSTRPFLPSRAECSVNKAGSRLVCSPKAGLVDRRRTDEYSVKRFLVVSTENGTGVIYPC